MTAVACQIPPEAQPVAHEPMPFPALEMRSWCRHCGREISITRFNEFQACTRCSSGVGWPEEDR